MAVSKKNVKKPSPRTTKVEQVKARQKEEKKPFKERFIENVKSLAWTLGIFYIVQTFVLQAFTIPTSSMENTLMVGDFIFVNKFVYGAQSPENIPFTDIQLPRFRLPSFKEPRQGDVLVFRFPHPEKMPSQKGLDYIKRCVAVAGQTVEIRNKELYVDSVRFLDAFPRKGIHFDENMLRGSDGAVFPRSMGNGDNFGPFKIPGAGDRLTITNANRELIQYLALRDHQSFEARYDGFYVDGQKTDTYTVGQNYYFMMGDNRDNSLDSRYWGPVPRDHIAGEGLLIYWSNVEAAKQTNYVLKLFSTLNVTRVNWKRIGTVIR